MPEGKEFCPYESAFYKSSAFKVVDGTKLHDVDPLHSATDGRLAKIVDGKVLFEGTIDPTDYVAPDDGPAG